jgi:hypothetical protein
MVKRPDEFPLIRAQLKKRTARQRLSFQIETTLAILLYVILDMSPAIRGRLAGQILLLPRHRDLRMLDLDRLRDAVPLKAGAESAVMIDQFLPSEAEFWRIDALMESNDHLLDIHPRMRSSEMVIQHALL